MGMTLSEAVERMHDPVGSDIEITILREARPVPNLTRDTIKMRSVRFESYGEISYIRLTTFWTTPGLKRRSRPCVKSTVMRLTGLSRSAQQPRRAALGSHFRDRHLS